MTGPEPDREITVMLRRLRDGSPGAADALVPVIYAELRRLAGWFMRRERPGHTLQPTALVHEAYFRLVGQHDVEWQNRAHFFSVAARIMRRILLDFARKRLSARRGGPRQRVTLDDTLLISEERLDDILIIDESLTRLAKLDERQSRIVELRFFGGLDVDDIARLLDISPITVKRDWNSARAWLQREISRGLPDTNRPGNSLLKCDQPGTMAAGQKRL